MLSVWKQTQNPKHIFNLGLPDMDVGEVNPIQSWNVDPNEPRYCLCNDVSYGEMVGCDNEDVSSLYL